MTTPELELKTFDQRIKETELNLSRLLEQRREFINRHNLNKRSPQ